MFSEQSVWHLVRFCEHGPPAFAYICIIVKIPKPKDIEESVDGTEKRQETENGLPQTLVRIPTEHAPTLLQNSAGGSGSEEL